MTRDWWWPWWVSTLIDLTLVAVALAVLVLTRRRGLRAVAAVFVVAGLTAAVLAPLVMKEPENPPMPGGRMQPPPMQP